MKSFLPLLPDAAEASWELLPGSWSLSLPCQDWTSGAVGTQEGCECVTASLTSRPLKNNGVSESQLRCQMGVSGLIAYIALFGKTPAQASHTQSVSSEGLQFSVIPAGLSFLFLETSHCILICPFHCWLLVAFRTLPISDSCIFFSKIVCSEWKGNRFPYYPSWPALGEWWVPRNPCCVTPKVGDFQHPGVLYFAMEIVSGNLLWVKP